MKKHLVMLIVVLIISACSTPPAPTMNPVDVQASAISFAWTSVSDSATANAPTNTFTPKPPTKTPRPSVTPTTAPQPIILTGSGDSVADFQKWSGPAIIKATYNSGRNFIVEGFDASGNHTETPFNKIGAYSGMKLLDIFDNDHTTRLEVMASGPWEIQILPLSVLRLEEVPKVINGTGDDVFMIIGTGGMPDLMKVDASQASRNFIVYAFGVGGVFDLLFNKIAPYAGTSIMSPSTFLIQVEATGPWSIEITGK